MKRKTKPKAAAAKADSPASDTSASDEFDVDEVNRKIKERIERMSSLANRSPDEPDIKQAALLQDTLARALGFSDLIVTKERSMPKAEAANGPSLHFTSSSPGALVINLEELVREGHDLQLAIFVQKIPARVTEKLSEEREKMLRGMDIVEAYKPWFDKSYIVIGQLLPEKQEDFKSHCQHPLIRGDHPGMSRRTSEVYNNHLQGDDAAYVLSGCHLLKAQCEILEQAKLVFDLHLLKSQQAIQADLLDSALCAARDFHKKGYFRAAGAMAGVVLEQHLITVLKVHSVCVRKKNLSIDDCRRIIKDRGIAEFPAWRIVQRLGDLRELCYRESEPKEEDVEELINGVDKIIKTLF